MNEIHGTLSNLPTEDEVEAEARSGSTLFGRFFKVARCERSLFAYICVVFFLVSYIYSVTRDMKDAIVIEQLDPSSIPYLKTLLVLPINVVLVFFIQRILVETPISKVFSHVCLIFGAYFCFYGIFLMAYRQQVELDQFLVRDWFADGKMLFKGIQWTIAIALPINLWTSALLYVSAEIWGTVVLQFLFFACSNEIYTQKQSLRFIPLFLIFGNVALVFSGLSMKLIKHVSERGSYEFIGMFRRLIFITLGILAILAHFIHRSFEKNIRPLRLFVTSERSRPAPKVKIGFKEGLQTIATSRLVIAVSAMVVAYSVSVNMVEASFKSCMNQYAIQKGKKVGFHVMDVQSDIQLAVGGLVIVLLLSSFPSLIRKKGFSYVAFVPPIFCIFGIIGVFGMAAINIYAREKRLFLGFQPLISGENLWLEQLLGVFVVVGFKLLKYSAVDISKEALSMKISPVYRARFKSVYDGICGKLGKAAGSSITNIQNILYNSSDVREASLFSLGIVGVITVFWGIAIRYLSGKYDKSVHNNADIDIDVIAKKAPGK